MTPTTAPSAKPFAAAPPSRPRRPGRFWRLAVRTFGGLTALVVLAGAMSAVPDARDARRLPASGELVELPDGRMLHLQVAGEQHDGATVVLDAAHVPTTRGQ